MSVNLSPQAWKEMEGHFVPRKFEPLFVVLSFFVSFIGFWATLELFHWRTGSRGAYNWFITVGAAVTMGGIAEFGMHFVGNRALILGDGQPELQIIYSVGFTILSFFIPVIGLFLAFSGLGEPQTASITPVTLAGLLAAMAVCIMHYLGQAGISNYTCVYCFAYFVGAGTIAVVAEIAALMILCKFRSSNAVWKRLLTAAGLAAALTGLHWLAAVGTEYQLKPVSGSQGLYEGYSVIPVIVLAVSAFVILLLVSSLTWIRMRRAAKRAQQVVLATAVFDPDGKLMVTPEGMLPSQKITRAYREQSLTDVFAVSHPAFLWMFRTSRYWSGIVPLIPDMRSHLIRIGLRRRFGSGADHEISDQGMVVDNYPIVFKELFCVAAADLAEDLKQPIENLGILYDEILHTGQDLATQMLGRKSELTIDMERDGFGGASVGSGQLLFLVKTATRQEVVRLKGAGYRFADIQQVLPLLSKILQVPTKEFKTRLRIMRDYASERGMLDPGVHLAFFAVRASLARDGHGFDILARMDAKNALPTMQLPLGKLETWHVEYLKRVDNFTVASLIKYLFKEAKPSNPSPQERDFAKTFLTTLEVLKEEINDTIFNDATLLGNPIEAPCHTPDQDSPPGTAILITFKIIVPLHSRALGKKLVFAPMNYFNVQQHCYKNSPEHKSFARMTHREFESTIGVRPQIPDVRISTHLWSTSHVNTLLLTPGLPSSRYASPHNIVVEEKTDYFGNPVQPPSSKAVEGKHSRPTRPEMRTKGDNSSEKHLLDEFSHSHTDIQGASVDKEKVPGRSGSPPDSMRSPRNMSETPTKPEGLRVEIREPGQSPGTLDSRISKEEQELKSFVDELFFLTVTRRPGIGIPVPVPGPKFQSQSTRVSAKSGQSTGRLAKTFKQMTTQEF